MSEGGLDIQQEINSIYGSDDLFERITAALTESGFELGSLSIDNLAPIDQLHGGELETTKALARSVEIGPETFVLDAGCGIGGTARFLAKTYGCRVVGIDLSENFVSTANRLNQLLGLSDLVTCKVGDVTNTGLEEESFDLAWSQGVLMNVEDKLGALAETRRVLKPGGFFLLQMVMRGTGPPDYPVLWASGPQMEFLCAPDEFRGFAEGAGFKIVHWQEGVPNQSPPPSSPPILNQGVVMGFADNTAAVTNSNSAIASGKVIPVRALLRKVLTNG